MKEDIVHVHLMQWSIAYNYNNIEEITNNDELSNMSKCVSIIDAFTLHVALGNQTDFVSFNGIVKLVFNFENLLASIER